MTPSLPTPSGTLIGFLVHYGEGSYAVVYATGREHCKRLLRERLATFQPAIIPEDRWIIEPITPVPTDPTVHLVTP